MFLCHARRLSAASLEQVFKSSGSFLQQVRAHRLRDVTLTLRKGHTFHRYRSLCVSVGGSTHLEKQPDPLRNRDSSGFITTDWRHLNRVAIVDVNLPRSQLREGGIFWRHGGRAEPLGTVLFTGNSGVSARHGGTGSPQPGRAFSTMKRDAGADHTSLSNKEDGQNLKEASSASTANAAGELEPGGGKLNKTQQLKKVFKEYGAVGVSFHIGISLMSLGMFYLLISSGIDMAAVLCKLGFSEAIIRSKMAAGTSTFVLAYAIHKLFAPVRISITLVSVPLIVRYFRKTGLFKPPTPAP